MTAWSTSATQQLQRAIEKQKGKKGRKEGRKREEKQKEKKRAERLNRHTGYPPPLLSYNDTSRVRGCRATGDGRRSDVLESSGERAKRIITKRAANPGI